MLVWMAFVQDGEIQQMQEKLKARLRHLCFLLPFIPETPIVRNAHGTCC